MATFVLLHGAWHDGSCWAAVAAELAVRGHRALAPTLPLHDPSATYAERLAPALTALDGAGDGAAPLVLVGHSMGSGYVPGVLAARPDAIEVHLCPGLGPLREGFPWPAVRGDGTTAWAPGDAIAALYPRLPAPTAAALATRLRPMAPPPDRRPRSAPRGRPPLVLIAEHDELFAPDTERAAVRERLGVDPIVLPGGHLPMAEDPRGLAAALAAFAPEAT